MRTISADNAAILAGGARQVAHRLSVKDAGGTYRDLSTYPGINLIQDLTWGENLDNPGVSWSATLTREQESISLAPYMADSPLNRGFNPAASYAALLQVGRMAKVEYSMQAEGDPRSRSWALAFEGYIDSVDSAGGDVVKLRGQGLEALIRNTFIRRERIYAYAQGGGADRGCYVWEPSTAYVLGDLVVPTEALLNGHFYEVTTAGTSAAIEPRTTPSTSPWPTGGGATIANGSVVFTEAGATSTSVGTAVETIMQQILDDNLGSGAVTLWCPVSPSWNVVWFLVTRQPTWDELKILADQIGWCLRYVDDSGTPRLKFFDPNRATTTSLRSFPATEVEEISKLSTAWSEIRNTIRVVFSDSQDLDPGGNPKRKFVEYGDGASITKYGDLFAEIAESSGSNIDSTAEAAALANAVLSDLSEPTADMQANLLFFFAFVEICDLYTLVADGVHFDSDQKFAVSSYEHQVNADGQSTSFSLRGKPASNGAAGWFERMADAVGADQHQLTTLQNTAPLQLAVDNTPVGGARIDFEWENAKMSKDTHFELHLSTAPSFTLSASTLVATGKERSFEVGNLDPAKPHYAVVVPITWNDSRPVRGSASAEVEFYPGRGKATHLDPNVEWGRLPLNGGFETQLDPAAPPDFWEADPAGLWGTYVTLGTSGGISGANYLKLEIVGGDPIALVSAEFTINELTEYTASFWRKCVSGTGPNVFLGIAWYDITHTLISDSPIVVDLSDNPGDWIEDSIPPVYPPAGARFARLTVGLDVGSVGDEVHVDSVEFMATVASGGGVTTIATFGSAPNTAGGSISGTTLTLQPTSATRPGGISTGNQTIGAGIKTFLERTVFKLGVLIDPDGTGETIRFIDSSYSIGMVFSPFQCLDLNGEYHYFSNGNGTVDCERLLKTNRFQVTLKDDQSGTAGNFSTDCYAGRAAFAGGASTVVITFNNGLAATADVYVSLLTLDATLIRIRAVATANTATFTGNAAATGITKFSWFVVQ